MSPDTEQTLGRQIQRVRIPYFPRPKPDPAVFLASRLNAEIAKVLLDGPSTAEAFFTNIRSIPRYEVTSDLIIGAQLEFLRRDGLVYILRGGTRLKLTDRGIDFFNQARSMVQEARQKGSNLFPYVF